MKRKLMALICVGMLASPLTVAAWRSVHFESTNCKSCGDPELNVDECTDEAPAGQKGYSNCSMTGDGFPPYCVVWGSYDTCISDQPGEG